MFCGTLTPCSQPPTASAGPRFWSQSRVRQDSVPELRVGQNRDRLGGLVRTGEFEVDDLDAANDRIAEARAHVEWPLHVNDLAHHREIWLRDPDNYRVILSGK